MTDKAYARLLNQLAQDKFSQLTPPLRENILAFYGDPVAAPVNTKRKPDDWKKTQDELEQLKEQQPTAAPHRATDDSTEDHPSITDLR